MASRSAAEPEHVPAPSTPGLQEPPIDPVPDTVREAARRAFTARDRNARVLGLATDSVVDEPAGTGPRVLTFSGVEQPGSVRVTVLELDSSRLRLLVECPWDDADLERVECGGAVQAPDPVGPGRWEVGPVPHGLLRAAVRRGGTTLHTAWLRV